MARAKRLPDRQADDHQRVQSGKRASALGLRVADALFDSPALGIGMLAKQMEVPYATARFQVKRLVALGVLRIEGRCGKEQLIVAPGILAVVGDPQFAG